MKQLLNRLVIVVCCMSVIGCANMSKQDVGVVSGGLAGGLLGSTIGQGSGQMLAIAAGTLAGAYIGGAIGKNMDDTDRLKLNRALESNNVGQPAYWHNNNTGAEYEVIPTKNVKRKGNRYCREYRTVANIGGRKQNMYGTACRQPDGSWQAVN